MNKNCYIDVHVIQSVPPSCVNRDDTGSPKTARYGGVTRARVSSQAWKHEIRKRLPEFVQGNARAFRTKKIVSCVAKRIQQLDSKLSDERAKKKAVDALKKAGLNVKSAENRTDALFFLSEAQAKALAQLVVDKEVVDKESDKLKYYNALNQNPSIDMALFGRMVASAPSLNYDAAVQVSHSISTHEVRNEFDFFTAEDDCAQQDNSGAGHIGTTEFNSATLYRYANVNVNELRKHLGEDTPAAVRGFVEAFVRSMPNGRQNSFANCTLPDMIYVAIRADQPINLVGAFEEPVFSRNGYVKKSIDRFCSYTKKLFGDFDAEPEKAFVVGTSSEGLKAENMSLKQLLEAIEKAVKEAETKGEE